MHSTTSLCSHAPKAGKQCLNWHIHVHVYRELHVQMCVSSVVSRLANYLGHGGPSDSDSFELHVDSFPHLPILRMNEACPTNSLPIAGP